jgi:TonB family protein
MLPDSNRKGSQNKDDQELLNTLGNPLASEDEWMHASDKLGDYKPKPNQEEQHQKTTRQIGEISFLAAMGLGIFALINFTQPSHMHAVAPPPPPTLSKETEPDYGPYMADLQRNIKRHWFPPKGQESRRVVVVFKVNKDGSYSNLKVTKSSDIAVADRASLRAVEDASKGFKPLPAGAPSNVDIEFTFDYNVWTDAHKKVFSASE